MKALPVICLLIVAASSTAAFSQNADQDKVAEESARIEDQTFVASIDDTEQRFVLVYPPKFDSAKPVSLLIALHGHGSDRWQFVNQTRGECSGTRDAAARHGMLLVSPDYRATTSWMGPAAEADLVQMIASLKKRFIVGHVVVSGGSMGGTGALTFTALHPELVDGVVSLNGTANLVDYARFSDAIAASFGGSRTDIPDEYRKRSAEFFPDRFTMPVAATTGGTDTVVPPDSVLRLLNSIQPKNKHVLSIHRPTGGHSTNYEDTTRAVEFVISRLKPAQIRTE
ncbi:MAG: alpha/beta fold hydrolase [Planctomycetota bacterium]|nr:alpha/beta fold hydrolase [Planctomycetota bacterium]